MHITVSASRKFTPNEQKLLVCRSKMLKLHIQFSNLTRDTKGPGAWPTSAKKMADTLKELMQREKALLKQPDMKEYAHSSMYQHLNLPKLLR